MNNTAPLRFCRVLTVVAAMAAPELSAAAQDLWIAARTDGLDGKGSQVDPRDGSTPAKFDGILAQYRKSEAVGLTIHLWPGVYQTRGHAAWTLFTGWRMIGSGMGETTVRLASLSKPDAIVIAGTGAGRQEVCDLTLDCNYRNLPCDRGLHNISGIRLQGENSAIRRVRVVNAGGDGDDYPVISIAGNAADCMIENCIVEKPASAFGNQTGISIGGVFDPDRPDRTALARGGKLLGNTVTECQRAFTADGVDGLVVANNRANACGYGWHQSAPRQANVIIAHNEFLGCKHGGITIGEALAEGCSREMQIVGNTLEVESRCTALGLFNRAIENTVFRFNRVRSVSGPSKAVGIAASVGRVSLEDNVFDIRMAMDIGSTNVVWTGNRGPAGQELPGVQDHLSQLVSKLSGLDLSALLPAMDPQDPPRQAAPLEAGLGRNGEIMDWLILGPFPHPGRPFPAADQSMGGAGYNFDFLLNLEEMGQGESMVKARTGASIKVVFPTGADTTTFWTDEQLKARRIAWQRVHAHNEKGLLDVQRVPNMCRDLDYTCIYAVCHLKTAADMPVRFKLGSDDGFVLFVNGRRVAEVQDDRRTLTRDRDIVESNLRAGDNLVVIKLCNAIGSFAMCARLTDRNDQPLQGVSVLLP